MFCDTIKKFKLIEIILLVTLILIIFNTNRFVKKDKFNNTLSAVDDLAVSSYVEDKENIIKYLDKRINEDNYIEKGEGNINKAQCYKNFYNNTGFDEMNKCRDILIDNQILKCKSDKYLDYINKQRKNSINTHKNYLNAVNIEPERTFNESHVQEFLKYDEARRFSQMQNPLSNELASMNSIPDTVELGEDDLKILYPSLPIDFYAKYRIREGQYNLLDNLEFELSEDAFIIYDNNGKKLKHYVVKDIKNAEIPRYPTTTIEITLEDTKSLELERGKYIKEDASYQKRNDQIKLINSLGLTTGNIYLYGNDGNYRLYNFHKMLLFHTDRL